MAEVGTKPTRRSFIDRYKQMMLATPRDLDPTVKLVLWALFSFAHDDGGSIYVSTKTLAEYTGLPLRTIFRCLEVLRRRGYVLDDGWKHHTPTLKTKLRRIDLAALQRDRSADVAAGIAEEEGCSLESEEPDARGSLKGAVFRAPLAVAGSQSSTIHHSATGGTLPGEHSATGGIHHSATGGTLPGEHSATGGIHHSATGGTQTNRENQEERTLLRSDATAIAVPSVAALQEPFDARKVVWTDGLAQLERITGKPNSAARSLMGKLLKAAGDDCAGLLQAIRDCPQSGDPIAWLTAAAKARGNKKRSATDEIRDDWQLPNFADASLLDDQPQSAPADVKALGNSYDEKLKRIFAALDGVVLEPSTGKAVFAGWYVSDVADKVLELARMPDPTSYKGGYSPLFRWLTDGVEPSEIYRAVRTAAQKPDYYAPRSLAFFDGWVTGARRHAA